MLDKYIVEDLQLAEFQKLQKGVYILLYNVLVVPPHLLVLVNGKVFSISTKGVEIDKEMELYWQLIQRNNVPCIFVELQLPTLFTLDELQEKIRLITSGFPAVQSHGVSCLMPIKEFCAEVYQTQKQSVNLVFDLLDALKLKNSIQAYFHINLQRELQNNTFTMQKYTVTDVHEAIYKSDKSFVK